MTLLSGDLAALRLAVDAHGSQTHGDRPFAAHLLDVAWEVKLYRLEDQFPGLLCAAFLHDIVEDTPATLEMVEDVFGCDVATWVGGVTDSTEGTNRAERKANTYGKTREHPGSVALKLCDRKANLKQCRRDGSPGFLRMYQREHAEFRAALYREGEFEQIWQDIEDLLWAEHSPETTKHVHPADPLVFHTAGDGNPLEPAGLVHVLYEIHAEDPTEFVEQMAAVSHAVCGVELGEGAGPTRLRHLEGEVSCTDCRGMLEALLDPEDPPQVA